MEGGGRERGDLEENGSCLVENIDAFFDHWQRDGRVRADEQLGHLLDADPRVDLGGDQIHSILQT